jgi:dTDP-4-amino-4,6-dideoxygalactose transaminase
MSIGKLDVVASRIEGDERHWPGADRIAAEIVTLPTHSRVTPADRDELLKLWEVGDVLRA